MSKKVLVAMSGGVDSSVAAALLKEQGCDVAGAYMKNWINEENVAGNCPWQQDIDDARAAANAIGIQFEVVNFIKEYRERVVNYLVEGYRSGLTPNPDVMCNRQMKFGALLDYALKNGCDAIATGHYCIAEDNPDGSRDLWEGADKNKEQSYFLAMLTQEQIRRAIFPLGRIHKPEVRAIARKHRLPNAGKKDSQGICFIGEVRINDFLEKFIPDDPGEIITVEGIVIGGHRGLHRHTLGQRHGMAIPSNKDNEHYVVVGKDLAKKQLIVAFDHPDSPGLFTNTARLHSISWTNQPITTSPARLLAKTRYRDPSIPITFTPETNNTARIAFDQPQRALAAGQVCALYDGEKLLGGGIYA